MLRWLGEKTKLMVVLLVTWLCLCLSGCATIHGAAGDLENASRWIREASEPACDQMEMNRIESAIQTQNRIMNRGQKMHVALSKSY